VGGVVKPGDTILNVVPLSATLEVEAQVLNKDIGIVLPGQRVTVKFDAFPFTRYGTIDGEVIDVSRTRPRFHQRAVVPSLDWSSRLGLGRRVGGL
jgi:hemolysin D